VRTSNFPGPVGSWSLHLDPQLGGPSVYNSQLKSQAPVIYVCSTHPVASKAIKLFLAADRGLRKHVKPVLTVPDVIDDPARTPVVILDIYSIVDWEAELSRCTTVGILPLVVIADQGPTHREQLRLIHLGVRGIVTTSAHFPRQLPAAVRSVAAGKLWISRSALEDYVNCTRHAMSNVMEDPERLTIRERVLIRYLVRGYSNKQLAAALNISERTVKFHVSNVLRKCKTSSRQGLIQMINRTFQLAEPKAAA
jgi:DNA-binding NarL/FixJ family response regulator